MKKTRFLLAVFCGLVSLVTQAQKATYNGRVKPILEVHCVVCHSKGCIGPMPFANYQQTAAYGAMIAQVTAAGRMPPGKGDEQYSHLRVNHALNEVEIATIQQWIDSGLEEGPPAKDSTPNTVKHLMHADYVFAMQKHFTPANAHTNYAQVFVIPTDLNKDLLVDALEFVPGNKRIIKSCNIAIDTSNLGDEFDAKDLKYGYSNFSAFAFLPAGFMWYQWTPEDGAYALPKDLLKRIPAHSHLLFYISYMPAFTDETQSDSSYLKVHEAAPVRHPRVMESRIMIDTSTLQNKPFSIERDSRKSYMASKKLDHDITIYSIMPMGQYVCKSWLIYALDSASGYQIPLLHIAEWDFNWRKKYFLEKPIKLTAGMAIMAIANYDNTEKNINLPILPPQESKYGESRRQEQFLVSFDISDD